MYIEVLLKKIITNYKFIEMKKILLLIVLASSFIGCSGDDNSDTFSLTGTWKGITYIREDNGVTYDTSTCDNHNNMAAYRTFIFRNDNTFHVSDHCSDGVGANGSFTFKNNELALNYGADETYTTNVQHLSGNKIKIKLSPVGEFILQKQ